MNSLKLEYPITKKDLHKGFNIKKQIDEKEKKEFWNRAHGMMDNGQFVQFVNKCSNQTPLKSL